MVYHGPSSGCGTCRNRRVKCSKERPACQQCTSRHITCLGYDGVFDNAYRDQKALIFRKVEKAKRRKYTNSRSDSASPTTTSASTLSSKSSPPSPLGTGHKYYRNGAVSPSKWILTEGQLYQWQSQCVIPAGIPEDYTTVALNFFLVHYAGQMVIGTEGSGFLSQLGKAVSKTRPESSLYNAVSAIALNIADLWSRRGLGSQLALSKYWNAVGSLRLALQDPNEALSDDALTAALLLDFFDAINAQFLPVKLSSSASHKFGALALVRQRGRVNFRDEQSKALLISTRSALVHHSLYKQTHLPEEAMFWLKHPDLPHVPMTALDELSVDLANFQARLLDGFEEDEEMIKVSHLSDLLFEGRALDRRFIAWSESLSSEWQPWPVPEDQVADSIHAAGTYRRRCLVYEDLPAAEVWNQWRSRRILLLSLLQTCFARLPTSFQGCSREIIEEFEHEIQSLADGLCESVPFFMGDCMETTNPLNFSKITYPRYEDHERAVPKYYTHYAQRAAAVGGWLIMSGLITLIPHISPRTGRSHPLKLRDGQQEWIKGQLQRLQVVWTFADPLWVERVEDKEELTDRVQVPVCG